MVVTQVCTQGKIHQAVDLISIHFSVVVYYILKSLKIYLIVFGTSSKI